MKTSIYLMLIIASGLLCQAQTGLGQNLDQRVSITLTNEPIRHLLDTLKKKTGLTFAYDPAIAVKVVTITANAQPVRQVLESALKSVGLTYTHEEGARHITIKRAPESAGAPTPESTAATITGTVINTFSREPLAGVNVIVKGTTRGTSADADGRYTIDARPNDILIFTFIGFMSFETLIGQRTSLHVSLEPDATSLEAVEVTGNTYYATAKEFSTSSIVKVNAKEIENQPVTSPLMALQGRVAGLEIMPTTGAPANASKIRIRGINTLRDQGSYPLFIIDGILIDSKPLTSSNGSLMNGGFDPLAIINPVNIESIEVLKDGDATAIYGSRGANGVIVIRTRKSRKETGTAFDVSVYTGAGTVGKHLDMMNREEYLAMRREAFRNDHLNFKDAYAPDLNVWDTTRHTDMQKTLLGGTSSISDIQGNIAGGNGNTSFRIGGGYHKETTIFPADFGYRRATAQVTFIHASYNKRFHLSLSMNYGINNNALPHDHNAITSALQLPPTVPELYTEAGDLNFEPYDSRTTFSNPLLSFRKKSLSKATTLFANSLLSYEITPGLTVKTNFGYTDLTSHEVTQTPVASLIPELRPISTGESTFGTNQRRSWLIEPQLQYIRSFNRHNLDLFLGTTAQQSETGFQSLAASGYAADAMLGSVKGATLSNATDDVARYKYMSVIARIGYNFDSKYIVNFTGRRDGSSRFGPDNRWGNFGSLGAAWIFSNEPSLQKHQFLNFGKIRSSYALTGNDQIGDYQYYNTYIPATLNYQSGTSLTPASLYNPDYQWETTRKWESAIELGFLQDKISLEVNYYRHRSSNQLIDYTLSATTGFSSVFRNFEAEIENTGWEFMLSFIGISSDHFKWTTSANLSIPVTRLVAFPDLEHSSYAGRYKVGAPLSALNLYTFQGVDPQTGSGIFLDNTKDGIINDKDKGFIKDLQQRYYGGVTNVWQCYGFELAVLIQFSNRPATRYIPGPSGTNINQPQYMTDRWRYDGDMASFAKAGQQSSAYLNFSRLVQSDFSIVDASFIRLKTVTLSYTLPAATTQKIKSPETRIFLHGQNLFTKTDYFSLDPETGINLPPLRMFTIGLQARF